MKKEFYQIDNLTSILNSQFLGNKNASFDSLSTDSRVDLKGQLFLALKGDEFDGHNFVIDALKKGATGVVLHRSPESYGDAIKEYLNDCAFFQVTDTLLALQKLGQAYRALFKVPVLGVTGSNGKTTTKEFAAQILGRYKNTHYSKGSFNNHWGVPLSLLQAEENTQVIVQEMGMNHAGEITELVKIANPTTVVCTTVGTAHLGYFGTQKKIAEAKEEIYIHSAPQTTRIYNLDNEFTLEMYSRAAQEYPQASFLTFSSQQPKADIYFKCTNETLTGFDIEGHIQGVASQLHISLFGSHNVINLMAASALALTASLTPDQIWQALPFCETTWGRNQVLKSKKGFEILFDGYNANPDSMKALLQNTLRLLKGKKVFAVLAQMRELGSESAEAHEALGKEAAQLPFQKIWFYGDDSAAFKRGYESIKNDNSLIVSSGYEEKLATLMVNVLEPESVVIVKGSRGLTTEKFVQLCEPLNFIKK